VRRRGATGGQDSGHLALRNSSQGNGQGAQSAKGERQGDKIAATWPYEQGAEGERGTTGGQDCGHLSARNSLQGNGEGAQSAKGERQGDNIAATWAYETVTGRCKAAGRVRRVRKEDGRQRDKIAATWS
jgi:hypothetical protein